MAGYEGWLRVGMIAGVISFSTFAQAQAPAPQAPAPPATAVPPPAAVPPATAVPPPAPPYWPAQPAPQPAWTYAPPPPAEISYVEGRAIPRGYHLETRPQSGMILAGLLVMGIPYVLSVSVAGESREHTDRWLLLPVAGPFINLAARPDCTTTSDPFGGSSYCGDDSGTRTILMLDGLMQVGGAVLTIVGLSTSRRLMVRDDYYGSLSAPAFTLTLAPRSYGRAGQGFALAGTF